MKYLPSLLVYVSISLWDTFLFGQNNVPSMDQLENLPEDFGNQAGELKDTQPNPPAAPDAKTELEANSPAQTPISIKDRIQKVLEPNLFSGAVPERYGRRNIAVDGRRPELIPGESPDQYMVKEGDTLFDICDQLLDDADYWPKLWSLNPEAGMGIINPHFIYPGTILRFRSDVIPTLVIEKASSTQPVDSNGLTAEELVREPLNNVPLLEGRQTDNNVMDPSQVEPISGISDMFYDIGEAALPKSLKVIIPGFIVDDDDAVNVLAEVLGGSAGSFLMDKGQDVVVEEDKPIELGKPYSILRKVGKVYTERNDDFVGYRYDFIAHVRIDTRDEASKTYKGKVILNRSGVEPGDLLVPYQSVLRTIPLQKMASARGNGQEVIGFTEDKMEVGGRGSFVFLAQVGETSLEVGKSYSIEQNLRRLSPIFLKNRLPDTMQNAAEMYVVDSNKIYALGYIVKDVLSVRRGDLITR